MTIQEVGNSVWSVSGSFDYTSLYGPLVIGAGVFSSLSEQLSPFDLTAGIKWFNPQPDPVRAWLEELFPRLAATKSWCPLGRADDDDPDIGCEYRDYGSPDEPEWSLERIVIHLNDDHCQSREWIADWLDTLDVDLRMEAAS